MARMTDQTKPALADAIITLPDSRWIRSLRRNVLRWFERCARPLPWRQDRTPYRVWVSEIMLQQTQVATVLDYYPRFVARFPSIESLARADSQDVLRYWEGLGYYRRAAQMHQAAQQIMRQHGGDFPTEIEQVRELPGIGRYTAGAILSIALDQRHPIVEANTTRLYCRLLAFAGDPTRAAGKQLLWEFADRLLPRRRVGELNQALMELGSIICTPHRPACSRCSVATLCPTRRQRLQDEIPRPKQRKSTIHLREAAVVIRRGNCVLIHRCRSDQRWAGLWDYPRFDVGSTKSDALAAWLQQRVKETTGLAISVPHPTTTIRHSVTRYRISLSCHAATCRHAKDVAAEWRWVAVSDLSEYPLSVTGRRISQMLLDE